MHGPINIRFTEMFSLLSNEYGFIAPKSWLLALERMKIFFLFGNRTAFFQSSSYPSSQTNKRCRRVLATRMTEPTIPLFKRWKTVPLSWVARLCVVQHQQVSQVAQVAQVMPV